MLARSIGGPANRANYLCLVFKGTAGRLTSAAWKQSAAVGGADLCYVRTHCLLREVERSRTLPNDPADKDGRCIFELVRITPRSCHGPTKRFLPNLKSIFSSPGIVATQCLIDQSPTGSNVSDGSEFFTLMIYVSHILARTKSKLIACVFRRGADEVRSMRSNFAEIMGGILEPDYVRRQSSNGDFGAFPYNSL